MNNDRQIDRKTDCKDRIKNVKKETCILLNIGTEFKCFTDIAVTLQARDYKGMNNYGSNGVIETYELDGN